MTLELSIAIAINIVVGLYAWVQTLRARDARQRLHHIGEIAQRLNDKVGSLQRLHHIGEIAQRLNDKVGSLQRELDKEKARNVQLQPPGRSVVELRRGVTRPAPQPRSVSPFFSAPSTERHDVRLDDLPIPVPVWQATQFQDRDDCERPAPAQSDATIASCPAPSPDPTPPSAPAQSYDSSPPAPATD